MIRKSGNKWLILPFILIFLQITADQAFSFEAASSETTPSNYANIDVLILVAYVSLALVFSFLCSVAESVLLSITPSYIADLQSKKPKKAALLKKLKQDDLDHSLAAILTLNTAAHTIGAIGAGAKATVIFGSYWFGLFSAIMTLVILFMTEITPKTLGAIYWQKLAGSTALFIRFLIISLYPLIWISEKLTRIIVRGKPAHVFSRDELVAMASIGEETGQINESESRMIRNLFRFGALKAKDVMTPRTVILAFQQDMTVNEALAVKSDFEFSRLPLYRTNIDEITGFILKDEILLAKAQGKADAKLKDFKREITVIIGSMRLSDLLELMLDQRVHSALVIGEYGETQGIVTLEDVVETLLGLEIVDEMDKVEDMRVLARQQWLKRAKTYGLEIDSTLMNQIEREASQIENRTSPDSDKQQS